MGAKMKQRIKYDRDFKRNAVSLCFEPGRMVAEVAGNLGIAKNLLYRWRREYHMSNSKPTVLPSIANQHYIEILLI